MLEDLEVGYLANYCPGFWELSVVVICGFLGLFNYLNRRFYGDMESYHAVSIVFYFSFMWLSSCFGLGWISENTLIIFLCLPVGYGVGCLFLVFGNSGLFIRIKSIEVLFKCVFWLCIPMFFHTSTIETVAVLATTCSFEFAMVISQYNLIGKLIKIYVGLAIFLQIFSIINFVMVTRTFSILLTLPLVYAYAETELKV